VPSSLKRGYTNHPIDNQLCFFPVRVLVCNKCISVNWKSHPSCSCHEMHFSQYLNVRNDANFLVRRNFGVQVLVSVQQLCNATKISKGEVAEATRKVYSLMTHPLVAHSNVPACSGAGPACRSCPGFIFNFDVFIFVKGFCPT